MTADDQLDVAVVECVERGEIGFTRHAECVRDALGDQLIDQDFATGARAVVRTHSHHLCLIA